MNQNEIYNLLLIILLLSNEKSNGCGCDNSCSSGCGNLNEIIIISLLMSNSNNNCGNSSRQISCNPCESNNSNNNCNQQSCDNSACGTTFDCPRC